MKPFFLHQKLQKDLKGIASRATSRQTAHPMPCGSHAVTRPRSSRAETKQSSLCRCPRFSQPQKHGILLSTSGCVAANRNTASTIGIGRAAGKGTCGGGGRSDGHDGFDAGGGTEGAALCAGACCAEGSARSHAAAVTAAARIATLSARLLDIAQS